MSHMKDAAIDAHNAGHDVTDLSKLSSTEIIAKIVNLALDCGGRWECVWTSELSAKLHVLTVILKQAIIREAAVAILIKTSENYPGFPLDLGPYYLVPKEDDVPLFAGLVATREELANMRKETA